MKCEIAAGLESPDGFVELHKEMDIPFFPREGDVFVFDFGSGDFHATVVLADFWLARNTASVAIEASVHAGCIDALVGCMVKNGWKKDAST